MVCEKQYQHSLVLTSCGCGPATWLASWTLSIPTSQADLKSSAPGRLLREAAEVLWVTCALAS